MPKEFKPGWLYIYSEILKQEIALKLESGRVYCEDGTEYAMKEIDQMDKAGQVIDPGVHLVKRIFKGEIVGVKAVDP
jgi:hypothetical protein